jgi:hypothetical protein
MIEPDLEAQQPPPPEDPPIEELDAEEIEGPPRAVDPAIVYIILLIIILIGLSNLAFDIRLTLVWSLLTIISVVGIVLDKVTFEPLNLRNVLIGIGFGALVGIPIMIVGSPNLQLLSLKMFPKLPDSAVFQTLVFTMPLAETLFFRGIFQAARGSLFAGAAAGVWTIALFLPALDVVHLPFVALVFSLCFLFINFLYSYIQHRFGLFSSWACQIVLNLLLLFVVRFIV